MLRKIIPPLLVLVAVGAGAGGGLYLRPAPDAPDPHAEPEVPPEYVKLNNQFVVPVLDKGRVAAMVILSLSLEIAPGQSEMVYEREPKLRDLFLQVLFDHANSGGFRGSFTDGDNMITLRKALREAAVTVLPDIARDVLIVEIVRQDS